MRLLYSCMLASVVSKVQLTSYSTVIVQPQGAALSALQACCAFMSLQH